MTTDITNLAIRRTESYSGDVEHDDVLGVITGHPQDRILLRRCLGRCGAGQNPIAPEWLSGPSRNHPQDRILLRRSQAWCGAGQNPIAPGSVLMPNWLTGIRFIPIIPNWLIVDWWLSPLSPLSPIDWLNWWKFGKLRSTYFWLFNFWAFGLENLKEALIWSVFHMFSTFQHSDRKARIWKPGWPSLVLSNCFSRAWKTAEHPPTAVDERSRRRQ